MRDGKTKKSVSAVASLLSGQSLGEFDVDIDELCDTTRTPAAQEKNIAKSETKFSDVIQETLKSAEISDDDTRLRYISCSEIIPWRFTDRPENEMGDINDLAESIKKHGQQAPALARKNGQHYELIFGNRRWRACSQIKTDLLCRIVPGLDDKTAAALQTLENLEREDLSDYARAISFKKMLDNKVFETEMQLGEKLRIPRATLNDILSYTRLPVEVSSKLIDIHKISRRVIVKLAVLSKDSGNKVYIEQLIQKINSGGITSTNMDYIFEKIRANKLHKNTDLKFSSDLDIRFKKNKDGSIKVTIDVPKKLVIKPMDTIRENIKKIFV